MKFSFTQPAIALLFCLSAVAASAQQNDTMKYFFTEPASLWDIAAMRLEAAYPAEQFGWGTLSAPSLDYDWDKNTPYIHYFVDFPVEYSPEKTEGVCKTMASANTSRLGDFRKDKIFSHAGYGSDRHKEKLTALQKQMEIQVQINATNIDRSNLSADPYVLAKNFTNGEYLSITCTTTGFDADSVAVTWR